MSTRSEAVRRIWEQSVHQDMQQQQAAMLYVLQVSPQERQALFEKVAQWVFDRMYKPKDGHTPIKGIEYVDGHTPTDKELTALIQPLMPTEERIKELIKELMPTENELLDLIEPLIPYVKDGVDGTTPGREQLAEIIAAEIENRQQALLGSAADKQKEFDDKLFGMIQKEVADKITQVKRFSGGGSGDVVKAGTGVTITHDVLGRKVINASGGGGATFETPVGDVDGSNTTFTVTNTPIFIISDGATYFENAGYTLAGLTVTMTVAPQSFIRSAY